MADFSAANFHLAAIQHATNIHNPRFLVRVGALGKNGCRWYVADPLVFPRLWVDPTKPNPLTLHAKQLAKGNAGIIGRMNKPFAVSDPWHMQLI